MRTGRPEANDLGRTLPLSHSSEMRNRENQEHCRREYQRGDGDHGALPFTKNLDQAPASKQGHGQRDHPGEPEAETGVLSRHHASDHGKNSSRYPHVQGHGALRLHIAHDSTSRKGDTVEQTQQSQS